MKLNPKIMLFIRTVISILLIWWIVQSDKLNWNNIKIGVLNYKLALIFFVLTFLQLLIVSYRTQVLTQLTKNSPLEYKKILSVSWGSLFLNCIVPTSVIGDIFRIKKFMNMDSLTQKDNFIYSSIFSKFFSVLSLALISMASGLFIMEKIPALRTFIICSYLVLIALIGLFYVRNIIFSKMSSCFIPLPRFASRDFIKRRIANFKIFTLGIIQDRKIWIKTLACSLLIQILNTLSFVLIIYQLTPKSQVNILELMCIVPVGIFLTNLPISYSGIGVGHVAFASLLKIFDIPNGADVFTIFFAFSFIFDFCGIFFFIKHVKN
ncbi:lysylphosphatidylglycerol synthase transmembrane domain-containing protein [Bacteriovorax sp. PP10]|uniref:Lysylphosphatidylglycerol synthase transmembrane domain-containing protein n=1 Tax=Bacteriovorax antarcticus TaxID=3088717 RepID=A0ABU5VVH1_9BACT|nr:lysylphosphatidylglycerol synthase transmembrane domain-containing protein [Bacteriovorax sp. PP10]MEA9356612.1 lysylphosphatidylglycerol synthase transmembrane domain-containing protein [Bacteriovorax sp. PP10]